MSLSHVYVNQKQNIFKMSFTDLPLLNDLLKPHSCIKPEDGSPCTCQQIAQKKLKPPVTDNKLRCWEQWMQKRKKVQQRLGKILLRTPGDLVMNSGEELRTVKEEKLALEYTKIPEPDLPRGGCPDFWKMPTGLKEECGKNETYLAVLTKEEKCVIPEIEHVGLPKLIMEEKNIFPRTRNSVALWERSAYVQDRSAELSHELKKIRPHKPNFDELFIEGVPISKVSKSQSTPFKNQPVQITFAEKVSTATPEENILPEHEENPSVLGLSINDLQLNPHMVILGTRKVYVLFDCDMSNKKVVTEHLTFKNLGTVTCRFYWKKFEKTELFKDIIPDKSDEINFYFNKNEGIIIPGQIIQFPIWFKPEESGTYYEQWEFYTKPRIMPINSKLVIVLQASVLVGDLDKKMDAVREQLNKNIRDRLIKECLFGVVSNIPYDKYKPTVYSYNKKDVFETVNSQFDPVHRQAKYLYNKEVVRELQKFYKTVRRPSDPKCWNYRIEELRLLAKAKQKKQENLKWLAQQEAAKLIYDERPQFPTLPCEKNISPDIIDGKQITKLEKSDIQKHDETVETEDSVDAKPLTEQLELIISKLECSAVEENYEQNKFTQAYLILCTYFNKISQEFEDLKDRLGIIKKTKYPTFSSNYIAPLCYKPSRLIHERFYEVLQGPPLTAKVGTSTNQPAAEALQAIPIEDSKRRYRTYFNIPDTPPPQIEKGKKKDKGEKGGKKDKKPDKKDIKRGKNDKTNKAEHKPATADSDEEDGYVVNESFDPYAHIELPVRKEEETIDEETIQSNIDTVLPAVLRQYKYNMYIIMYNYLDKAVSNIVDMIEMQPKENLPYAVIKEFEEPAYNRRLIDLKGLLAEERSEQLKAKLLVYKYRKYSKADWRTTEVQRQLKNVKSDSSLWSVLRPFETKPKLPDSKPISYPIDHYDILSPKVKTDQIVEHHNENGKSEDVPEPQLMVNISTSTLEGGIINPNYEDWKDVGIQKDYGEEEEPEDLVAFIEKIVSQTSVQNLVDIRLDKAVQKKTDDHVSDEEYFYDSESDIDTEAMESSIDSEQSEEGSCGFAGFGVHNLPVEEHCSCDGYGECNEPKSLRESEGYIGINEGHEENKEPYQFTPPLPDLTSNGELQKSNIPSLEKNPYKCKGKCK